MQTINRRISILAGSLLTVSAHAQVPDLLNAFDAGGRSLGMAGSLHATEPSTLSTFYNPASLAFIRSAQVGLDFRNLPKTNTSITNTLISPNYSTSGSSGPFTLSNLGFATPVSD